MIEIPDEIQARIEELIAKKEPSALQKAYLRLQERYRGERSFRLETEEEHLSYLLARFPGTFAAASKVIVRLSEMDPSFQPQTLLDLGSGPGTALLAASNYFPIKQATLVEQNSIFIKLGSSLLQNIPHEYLKTSFSELKITNSYDMILASYSLSETDEAIANSLITQALDHCTYLVLIEPGTPYGFSRLLSYRTHAIQQGAFCLAPCPHEKKCPMGTGWCHFSERLPRTHFQKMVKHASLGYEDEKYSYVILSKKVIPHSMARIVQTPKKHSGHVQLVLCTTSGNLESKTVSKRHKDLYKLARDAEWGDLTAE